MTRASDPAAPTPAQLDAAALARLQALDPEGRHGVVRRVLATYEGALTRQLDQLRAERDTPTAALANLAHTLKSSSASVGALALADACAALEQRLRHGAVAQTHDVAHLVDLGEAALAAVRTMLRQ
ncbi:MAG: Hpt domain-containing protein [Rubrivivax sp.]|nr:Hpt domain-containing protein [Rubrivivax sp.]